MKKILFILFVGLNVFSSNLFAIEPIQINKSISIEVADNQYVISFKSPSCEENVVAVKSEKNTKSFSQIVYEKEAEDIFDYVEGAGVPNIPFVTLTLQIPQDAKYSVKIEDIQYMDVLTGEISTKPIPYRLKYSYSPCQEFSADEKLEEIQFDKEAYSKEQFNELYTISEPFGAIGTQGFTFNMYPFLYLPEKQSIIVIHSAKYIITVDGDKSLSEMIKNELSEPCGYYFYDIYLRMNPPNFSTDYKGKYLIITTNDTYADALKPYINHKRRWGYDVIVHVQHGGYTDAETLRDYIKSMYDNIKTRPQYVLLVGEYTTIPIYDINDNPTDIYYACLEKAKIGTETNFFPEVYIGRWPISSVSEITSIVNKVIAFEQQNIFCRTFELYSGTGHFHLTFESDMKKAAKKLLSVKNSNVAYLPGSDSRIDDMEMRRLFANQDVLMMVYSGHGDDYGIGNPFRGINKSSVGSIENMPYFTMGFACYLNYPETSAFGTKWIIDGDRTVAFYGSMLSTSIISDTYLCKHIFDYFTSQKSNIRYSQIIQFAAGKYYNALQTLSRKREVKKYLFLGDPTIYTFGNDMSSGNSAAYIKQKDISEGNGLMLTETEKVKFVKIYNILGQLILQKRGTNTCSTEDIKDLYDLLGSGTYIVSVTTTENEYIQKFNK